MSDPWGFFVVAMGFLGWVMAWVLIVLAVMGFVIIVFAVLVGFYQGIKAWFPKRKPKGSSKII